MTSAIASARSFAIPALLRTQKWRNLMEKLENNAVDSRKRRAAYLPDASDHTQIREWIAFACESCRCPEVAKVKHSFNARLRSAVGVAWNCFGVYGIELASHWWPRLTDEGRRDATIHEACHCIYFYLYGRYHRRDHEPHGLLWKRLMLRCGVKPSATLLRCHVKEEHRPNDEYRPAGLVIARCGCTGHRKIDIGLATLIRRGERFECDVCRRPFVLVYA
jgi:predicted SprT family Zn-dependent metalloprotease